MQRLVAGTPVIETADLAEVYAYPNPLDRPFVRVNFVSSADGTVSVAGRSRGLSSPADHRVFHLLRALSDVVLVGAGTARVEGYRDVRFDAGQAELRRRLGLPAAVPLAVVSGSAALRPDSGLFTRSAGPPIVLTTLAAPAANLAALAETGAEVIVAGDQRVEPATALAQLAERGLYRVLCEGGPELFGDLIAADLVDELCLTLAPLLVAGPAGRIARTIAEPAPRGLSLASVLHDDGTLLLRYRRLASTGRRDQGAPG